MTTRNSIEIIIRPTDSGRKFLTYLATYGNPVRELGTYRDPWHQAARALIAEGRSPGDLLTMSYETAAFPAMRGLLGKAAGLMTEERSDRTVRTVKYVPPPSQQDAGSPSEKRTQGVTSNAPGPAAEASLVLP